MEIKVHRIYGPDDMAIIRKVIRKKHGRMEKIRKILQVKKCTDPEVAESYIYLLSLEDERIEEEVIIEDRKAVNYLTTRRMELIDVINGNEPISIKQLANHTGRDYKNVYDDVYALSSYHILNVVKYGKERTVLGKVISITLTFTDKTI